MAREYHTTDPVECWNHLAEVLSYGHTIPFYNKQTPQVYVLSEGMGSWGWGYRDYSCPEYLMEDIQFALWDQGVPRIELFMHGKEYGPVCSDWTFTFDKGGLIKAHHSYNDD